MKPKFDIVAMMAGEVLAGERAVSAAIREAGPWRHGRKPAGAA